MVKSSPHLTGLLVAGTGVILLSPDALLVRLITVGPYALLVWRGTLMALALCLFLARRGVGPASEAVRRMGRAGALAGLLFGASTFFFVLALHHTTVAKTLVILATGPIFAVFFSHVFLGERVGPRTLLAIAAAIAGIVLAVWRSDGSGGILGDLFAAVAGITFAGQLAVIRSVPARDMTPAIALGGILVAAAALPLAGGLALSGPNLLWVPLLGLVVLPVAFALISLGPRWLPAPEVNLLMVLETVLGPVWVWLALAERPTAREILGGAIVITALAVHSAIGIRRERKGRHAAARSEEP